MSWKTPAFVEINMSAEIGAYQGDADEDDPFSGLHLPRHTGGSIRGSNAPYAASLHADAAPGLFTSAVRGRGHSGRAPENGLEVRAALEARESRNSLDAERGDGERLTRALEAQSS
jgi:hypothetical protein